jgi:hypothetical protein
MATNAQYLAANLANHYNFKQQQFNNILKYLVSQESITPGASTALIEDIQRQQSALKERRLALSRLRQSGLLADKELIVELEKIKSDLKEVTARGITDVNVAKANLERTFQSELADEEAQGQSQFNRAVNAPKAQEAFAMEVISPGATEQEIVDSVVRYLVVTPLLTLSLTKVSSSTYRMLRISVARLLEQTLLVLVTRFLHNLTLIPLKHQNRLETVLTNSSRKKLLALSAPVALVWRQLPEPLLLVCPKNH